MEKYNWKQEEQTKQKCWRRPIFPGRFQPSIFGAGELNFCGRNGNRWTLTVKITNYSAYACQRTICSFGVGIDLSSQSVARQVFSALVSLTSVFGMGTGGPSPLKTPTAYHCTLKTKQRNKSKASCLHNVGQALGLLVSVGWTHYCAYTPDLSNS